MSPRFSPLFPCRRALCAAVVLVCLASLPGADDEFFVSSPFVQATAAFEQGDLGRAEALAVPLTEGAGSTAEAWSLLGQIRLQQKRPAEAVAAFERAVALRPASAALRCRLGGAVLEQAEGVGGAEQAALLTRARAELERAADDDPACVDAQLELLRFHLIDPAAGPAGAAERLAERAVELDPLSSTYAVARLTERFGRFDLAERYYAATERQSPGNPWLELKCAAMRVRLGRVAEARAQLEGLLQRTPGFKPAADLLRQLPPE